MWFPVRRVRGTYAGSTIVSGSRVPTVVASFSLHPVILGRKAKKSILDHLLRYSAVAMFQTLQELQELQGRFTWLGNIAAKVLAWFDGLCFGFCNLLPPECPRSAHETCTVLTVLASSAAVITNANMYVLYSTVSDVCTVLRCVSRPVQCCFCISRIVFPGLTD